MFTINAALWAFFFKLQRWNTTITTKDYSNNITKCKLYSHGWFSNTQSHTCYASMYVCMYVCCVYVTEFTKRNLIHASNFSNLRLCNSTCIWPTALTFGCRTVLSLYLWKFWLNSSLINEVRPLQSHKIGCMYVYDPFGHTYDV